jgi:dual specificity phosphatase 12
MIELDMTARTSVGDKEATLGAYLTDYRHMMIDIDDVDYSDILVHFPKVVAFIDEGLNPNKEAQPLSDTSATTPASANESGAEFAGSGKVRNAGGGGEADSDEDAITVVPKFAALKLRPASEREIPAGPRGAVFVHCAMGKSRSVSAIVAYLLWRYPKRFGGPGALPTAAKSRRAGAPSAVEKAVLWVRNTRQIAEPNPGFIKQLELWWEMGCPADVESHPIYQKWAYRREIDDSVACGMAPARLRFEDEAAATVLETLGESDSVATATAAAGSSQQSPAKELRCKKCRRVLATAPFIIDHQPPRESANTKSGETPCPHFFIEPLSWMRPTLEKGELDGRLTCPNEKCGAITGRYSWKSFKCSCRQWVTPAFALSKAKVDEITMRASSPAALASMGIRMPPGNESNRL